MAALHIRLLGHPRLEMDGVGVELTRRKALALFIYLAVSDRPHGRDTLATLFYPDYTQRKARAYLRRDLAVLNTTPLKSWLATEQDTVTLTPDADLWLDVAHFRQRLATVQNHHHNQDNLCADCVAFLAEAVELYTDDFLAGFTLRDCPDFDDWQFFQAESLRQDLAAALERLAQGYCRQGDPGVAIPHARRWVALDPLHEPAQQALMQIYHQAGQQVAALRQYEGFAELLEAEMGLPPGEETQTLYEAIKANRLLGTHLKNIAPQAHQEVDVISAQPATPPLSQLKPVSAGQTHIPSNLPAPITPFIGREREVAAIKAILAESRLLTLTGPGGIGKTRLALAVAQQLEGTFANGIYFVDLSALSQPIFVASSIAAVLDVIEVKAEPLAERLKNAILDRELLLVLDNFEHVLEAAPLIADLLEAGPGLKILVTSREVLQVYGEATYPIPPLSLYDGAQGETWDQSEAVQLFLQRAQAIEPDFQITPENETTITEICRRLDGLPLGIELAAARIKMLTPTLILERLDQMQLTMRGGKRGVPHRQITLGQAIGWSVDLLNAAEKRLFARLSVFRGGATFEAIERICGPDLTVDIFSGLESLLNKSLMRRESDVEGIPRFGMLETLRSYAEALLDAPAEARTLHRRHALYFVEMAEQIGTGLHASQQREALSQAEVHNFYAATLWSLDHDPDLGLRLIVALGTCWHLRSHFANAFHVAQEVLLASESTPTLLRAQALCSAADLALLLGHYDRGTTMGQEALELAQHVGDDRAIAWAQHLLAQVQIHPTLTPTELEKIDDCLQDAIHHYEQAGDPIGVAKVRLTRCDLAFLQGAVEQAVTLSERSLADFQTLDFQPGVVAAFLYRAWLAYSRNDVGQAEKGFREILERSNALQFKHAAMMALVGLACLQADAGLASLAAQLVGAAETIQRDIGATLTPMQRLPYDQTVTTIRNVLDEASYQAARQEGHHLSLAEAIRLTSASWTQPIETE